MALLILAGMLVMFLRETYPVEVVAVGGAVVMLVLGILPTKDIGGVLSNNAPWTIAAMFMIVGALVRTGGLEAVSQLAAANATRHPAMTLVVLGVGVTGVTNASGGAGVAGLAFESALEHLRATLESVAGCPCSTGCPSCVQSPKCGNGNDPLDKAGAIGLLRAILDAGYSTKALNDSENVASPSTEESTGSRTGAR